MLLSFKSLVLHFFALHCSGFEIYISRVVVHEILPDISSTLNKGRFKFEHIHKVLSHILQLLHIFALKFIISTDKWYVIA